MPRSRAGSALLVFVIMTVAGALSPAPAQASIVPKVLPASEGLSAAVLTIETQVCQTPEWCAALPPHADLLSSVCGTSACAVSVPLDQFVAKLCTARSWCSLVDDPATLTTSLQAMTVAHAFVTDWQGTVAAPTCRRVESSWIESVSLVCDFPVRAGNGVGRCNVAAKTAVGVIPVNECRIIDALSFVVAHAHKTPGDPETPFRHTCTGASNGDVTLVIEGGPAPLATAQFSVTAEIAAGAATGELAGAAPTLGSGHFTFARNCANNAQVSPSFAGTAEYTAA